VIVEVHDRDGNEIVKIVDPQFIPRIGEDIHYNNHRYHVYYICHYLFVNKVVIGVK